MYVHASCASCDLATLPQAVQLSSAVRLRLALHVVIVVCLAARANEEARAQKRCRGGSHLLDFRNGVGEGSGVHKDLLVEPDPKLSAIVQQLRKTTEIIPGLSGRHFEASMGGILLLCRRFRAA